MTAFLAYLCLAGFLVFFVAWLVTVLPANPLDEAAERRYHATEAHVRRVGR